MIAIIVSVIALSGLTVGWAFSRRYRARSALGRMGIEVSDQSLVQRIEDSDPRATGLLLRTGIRPDVPVGGRTPLAAALAAGDESTLSTVIAHTPPGALAAALLRPGGHRPATPEPAPLPSVEILFSAQAVVDHLQAQIAGALEREESIEIRNLGLDLEFVQTFLLYQVIFDRSFYHLSYRGMLVDVGADQVRDHIDGRSSIHSGTANAVIEKINNHIGESAAALARRSISIEIRTYDTLPNIHGFLVDDSHLYVGFTEFDGDKLQGGQFPYLYLRQGGSDEMTAHLCRVFGSWFRHYWDRGTTVCET